MKILKILVITFLLIAPFLVPIFSFDFNAGNLLTVVSLLFAIIAGFFIASTTSNYLRRQTLIANENSALISIFLLTKQIQPSKLESIADKIDQYLISILDYNLLDYPDKTRKELFELIETIDSVNPENDSGLQLFPNLHEQKAILITANQEGSLIYKTIMRPLHWFVVILLAVLMSIFIFGLRGASLSSSIITSILLVGIFEVLDLIRSIDTNQFLANILEFQSPQIIFKTIGRLNYYPEIAIKNRWIKLLPEKYRIGIYKNFPASFDKVIKKIPEIN